MLLTIKEVAAYLRISLSMAYRLVASGEIPCYEIGTCKRVSDKILEEYLEQQISTVPKPLPSSRKHF